MLPGNCCQREPSQSCTSLLARNPSSEHCVLLSGRLERQLEMKFLLDRNRRESYEERTGVRGIQYQVIMETIRGRLLAFTIEKPGVKLDDSIWKAVVNRHSRDGRVQGMIAIFRAGVKRTGMLRSVALERNNISTEVSLFYAKSRFI